MRVWTAQKCRMNHVRQIYIVNVQSLTHEQARVLIAFDPFTEISSCHKYYSSVVE
jgi:hypothetical protein